MRSDEKIGFEGSSAEYKVVDIQFSGFNAKYPQGAEFTIREWPGCDKNTCILDHLCVTSS